MQKPSSDLQIVSPSSINDITPEPGQVFMAPCTPVLFNEKSLPINNTRSWPEWWKEVESAEGSVRRCAGTADYLSLGFSIPLWAGLKFRLSPNKRFWETQFDIAGEHPFAVEGFSFDQTGPIPVTKVRSIQRANYVKIINPWVIKTAPGWSSMFLPPMYEPDANWTILPAVVNTDYYHHAHIVLNVLAEDEFTIPLGQPMQHIIPFERSSTGIEMLYGDERAHHLMDQEGFGTPFIPKNMKSRYKKAQREVDASLPKCPFGHGESETPPKTRRWFQRKTKSDEVESQP